MNNIKQALESAIEALNLINNHAFRCGIAYEAIKACKAALEHLQTNALDKCEPVAWISNDENFIEFRKDSLLELSYKENEIFPLYTLPPQQQWVGLNYPEILDCLPDDAKRVPEGWQMFYENIEAKLKQLNTKG